MYTGDDVSVILPWTREEGMERCVAALRECAPDVEMVVEHDPYRIGVPKMIAKLTEKTTKPIVCFLADDTVPLPGFLEAGLRAMETLPDGWGVVGLNWKPDTDRAGHWMIHKNMLPLLGGEFHHTGYKHCYGSDELTDRAKEMGRYVKAHDARIIHNSPIDRAEDFQYDPILRSVYGADGTKWNDFMLYAQRKRERLQKMAIGFPLIDSSVPAQFFLSFSCMQKPSEYLLLMPELPHGPMSGSIATARNSLVIQALSGGASHLLMLDTDQVYPPDTLTRLMRHQVEICGVTVHSRWMPFSPNLYRGEIGRYQWIPDEEMWSGDLVEIDATGTGCLLLDMEIFDKVEPPWFEFQVMDGRPVGEDIWFCSQVRKAGVRIFVDTSIKVGHLTTVEINEAFYRLFRKLTEDKEDG